MTLLGVEQRDLGRSRARNDHDRIRACYIIYLFGNGLPGCIIPLTELPSMFNPYFQAT